MIHHLVKTIAAYAIALSGLAASGWALADPPSRVARVAYESGVVTFSPAGDDEWARAPLNRPLTSGDRLWVDADSRAELQIGGAALRLGDTTSASLLNFDDQIAQLRLEQGKVSIRVWRMAPDQSIEIDTPNLAYVIRQPGSYRIDVDADDGWTAVTTRAGGADVYGEDASFRMRPGDAYRFYDNGLRDYDRFALGPLDALDRWAGTRDRGYEQSVSARYVPRELIGYQDLDEYGHWRDAPGYGHVWVPARVEAGWAPYRDGHWSWVEPWGWTWVDDAPWGFACSHYGRWANLDGQWAWVPGPANVRAVYAPALVAFVGGGGFRLAFGTGSAPAVAWFPLAPREVYRPPYQVSREYFTRVNSSNTVVNVTQITNVYNTRNVTNVVYANQRVPGAVVAMPAQAFVQSRPVGKDSMRVQPQQIASIQAVPAPPVAPVRTSFLGGAAPAPARHPPEATSQRPVVARTPPPPRPMPIAERVSALAAHPGQPLAPAPAAAAPARGAAPAAPAAPVKVLQAAPARALPTAPPPPPPGAPAHERRGGVPTPAASAAARPAPAPAAAAASHGAAPQPAAPVASAPTNRGQPPAAPQGRPAGAVPPPPPPAAGPRIESPRARDEARDRPAPPAAAAAPAASHEAAPPPGRPARGPSATPPASPAPVAPPRANGEPPRAAPAERQAAPGPRAAPSEPHQPTRPEAAPVRPAPPPSRAEAPRAEPPHPTPPAHAAPPAREEAPPHPAPPPQRGEAPHPAPPPPHPAAPAHEEAPPHPAPPPQRAEAPHPAPPPPHPAAPAHEEAPPRPAPPAHGPASAAGRREHASEPRGER
jgi:hypothetical protein